MHYPHSDSFLSAGFANVAQYDPATYARMESARWDVRRMNFMEYMTINGFGATHSVGDTDKTAETVINDEMITEWAHDKGVHVALFCAAILVHEFRHIHQPEDEADSAKLEIPAFAASSAFASKLPNPDGRKIKDLSESTLRYVKRHDGDF